MILITNPIGKEEEVCVDLTDNLTASPKSCDDANSEDYRRYDPSVLQFCEGEDARMVAVQRRSPKCGPAAGTDASRSALRLPSPSGWWQGNKGCLDGNVDGGHVTEDGIEWTPADEVDLLEGSGDAVEAISYIHVSVTYVEFGWSTETIGFVVRPRCLISTSMTKRRVGPVGIPNWVCTNFRRQRKLVRENQFNMTGYLETTTHVPHIFLEAYRVTDYRLTTDEGPII